MKEISSSDFEKEVINGGNVVLDFYSSECPPCDALAPKFESLSQLYGNDIKFLKIFRQQNRELATELGVSSSPTLLFFQNGKPSQIRLSGGIKRKEIIAELDKMVSEDRRKEIKSKIKKVETETDVIILGGGPAGLAAGIYLAQAKIATVLVDKSLPGGQVSTTHQVSNYPGFPEPINGYMLSHYMSEQCRNAGVNYKAAVDVTHIDLINKSIEIDESEKIKAKIILLATGASPRYLNIPGEKELKGNGISYCATCDAKYYHDKEVVIIGGGNTAVEESEFISKFASKITMIHQFAKLTSNKEAAEKALANPKINFLFECEPRSFEKSEDKMWITYENLTSKELSKISTDGVFIFAGMSPNTEGFENILESDTWGYIRTNDEMLTSMPGVYAVGDMISKKIRQITTAVADGTIAAIAIAKTLDN